ncbi:mCG1044338, partial [Mus musculus]
MRARRCSLKPQSGYLCTLPEWLPFLPQVSVLEAEGSRQAPGPPRHKETMHKGQR